MCAREMKMGTVPIAAHLPQRRMHRKGSARLPAKANRGRTVTGICRPHRRSKMVQRIANPASLAEPTTKKKSFAVAIAGAADPHADYLHADRHTPQRTYYTTNGIAVKAHTNNKKKTSNISVPKNKRTAAVPIAQRQEITFGRLHCAATNGKEQTNKQQLPQQKRNSL